MNQKNFSLIVAVIFFLIALMHALRLAYGWNAIIAGVTIPLWMSWIALFLGVYLSYQGYILSRKS